LLGRPSGKLRISNAIFWSTYFELFFKLLFLHFLSSKI
jgi:hypothetical protein